MRRELMRNLMMGVIAAGLLFAPATFAADKQKKVKHRD
jgi:hypothetical protein